MKRLLSIAAIAALTAATAPAKVPETLRRQTSDTDAVAFYNAMDDFEAANPDGTTLVTYDSYPDGTKVISRRIDWHIRNTPALQRICAVFDSITAKSDPKKIAIRNINGNNEVRIYKLKESDNDITVDFSGGTSKIGATSACINIGADVVLAQNWTVRTGKKQGSPDLKRLARAIEALAAEKGARTLKGTAGERSDNHQSRNSLRQRRSSGDNRMEYERTVLKNAGVHQWINLHHVFMESVGADGNISLTYERRDRMVSLIDQANKTIYTACYTANSDSSGRLVILTGKYTGEPFLPAGWASSNLDSKE